MAMLHPGCYHSSRSTRSWSFPRIFLTFFTALITITILISKLKVFLTVPLGPRAPLIQLNSLSIPYFAITNANMAGIWIANLTLYNPNQALELYMNHIEASIFYKQDNALSVTSVHDFELESDEERVMYVKFTTTGKEGDQPIVEYPLLREIEEDLKRRKVEFSLRMSIMGTYKIGWWSRHALLTLYCMDLDLGFVDGTADLIGGGPRDCLVLLMLAD